jgi:hypothetical protein
MVLSVTIWGQARDKLYCSGAAAPLGSPWSENIQRAFIKYALKFIVSAWNYLSIFAILFLYKKPIGLRAFPQGRLRRSGN